MTSLVGLTVDPNTYDITILRGDDQDVEFTVVDSAGVAQNITGWAFSFTVKAGLDDPIASALFQRTVGAGIALTTPLSGILTVSIASANTAAMAGNYVYDLQGVDTGGLIHTVRLAKFMVRKNVSTSGTITASPVIGTVVIGDALYRRDSITATWYKITIESGVEQWYGPNATIPF